MTRKTDKGLPRYADSTESDVFLLSGAEDLVPIRGTDGALVSRRRTVDASDYQVVRYRSGVEGLCARIERWTAVDGGQMHWRSISRDNVTTVYAKDDNSRIADPADPADQVNRVSSWLICESYDAKGNAVAVPRKTTASTRNTAATNTATTLARPQPNLTRSEC